MIAINTVTDKKLQRNSSAIKPTQVLPFVKPL
jgi:hypothetical protein